jgi:ribonuclease HII
MNTRSSKKPPLTFSREIPLWAQGIHRLAGVDEVGRGALAGPVIAAAVIFPPHLDPERLIGVRDSKQLSAKDREAQALIIQHWALASGIGSASVAEIDTLNIRRATALAMQRALAKIAPVDHCLVDGLFIPELGFQQTAVVKGDTVSLSIAAASILAKVYRDQHMTTLDQEYPGYSWSQNKGYGTRQHQEALLSLGMTQHHRHQFLRRLNPSGSCQLPIDLIR